MNLSDIKTEGHFKGLFLGDSGVGKTCLGATFPGPIELLDFDLKADSAAAFLRSKGQSEKLTQINVEQFAPPIEDDAKGPSPIDHLTQLIAKKYIPQQRAGKMEFSTLMLDSITTFSIATLKHIVKSNPGIKRVASIQGVQPCQQDYGILKREFQRLIHGLLSLPCNVIMLAHIDIEKDESTGQIFRHSMMDGSFARQLPIYFKECWRLYIKDGKRMAQTQSDNMFNCRSQIPGLPAHLDVTEGYAAIAKYIK